MKRIVHDDSSSTKDSYDIAWEEQFGSDDECMKFDSLEEFHQWIEEVKDFENIYD